MIRGDKNSKYICERLQKNRKCKSIMNFCLKECYIVQGVGSLHYRRLVWERKLAS